MGGAKAGLFPGLSGRGGDVVSLPGLLQTSQTDVEVLHLNSTVPHGPLHDIRGAPDDKPPGHRAGIVSVLDVLSAG